jgi:hypothetical protein
MIARSLRGLGALALISLALIGWPVALLGLADAVAAWLPDLSDPAEVLSRPDTGGLFLVIVLALGWIAWAIWSVALVVEVAAQVRGVPTPRLGDLFPQNATAALVTTIAVAFTIAPTAPAIAGTPGTDHAHAASTSASQTGADRYTAAERQSPRSAPVTAPAHEADRAVEDLQGDYTVVRGDTLWDIADEQLDDPTRWPEIAEDSEQITQTDGRHLSDPDLILPGWRLNIPSHTPERAAVRPGLPVGEAPTPDLIDAPPTDATGPVAPPVTPMRPSTDPTEAPERDKATGIVLPSTPLTHPVQRSSDRSGIAGRAASAAAPIPPSLPLTPMNPTMEPVITPSTPRTAIPKVEVNDESAGTKHGVPGLPNWITWPLAPVNPEAAPDLVVALEARAG